MKKRPLLTVGPSPLSHPGPKVGKEGQRLRTTLMPVNIKDVHRPLVRPERHSKASSERKKAWQTEPETVNNGLTLKPELYLLRICMLPYQIRGMGWTFDKNRLTSECSRQPE